MCTELRLFPGYIGQSKLLTAALLCLVSHANDPSFAFTSRIKVREGEDPSSKPAPSPTAQPFSSLPLKRLLFQHSSATFLKDFFSLASSGALFLLSVASTAILFLDGGWRRGVMDDRARVLLSRSAQRLNSNDVASDTLRLLSDVSPARAENEIFRFSWSVSTEEIN